MGPSPQLTPSTAAIRGPAATTRLRPCRRQREPTRCTGDVGALISLRSFNRWIACSTFFDRVGFGEPCAALLRHEYAAPRAERCGCRRVCRSPSTAGWLPSPTLRRALSKWSSAMASPAPIAGCIGPRKTQGYQPDGGADGVARSRRTFSLLEHVHDDDVRGRAFAVARQRGRDEVPRRGLELLDDVASQAGIVQGHGVRVVALLEAPVDAIAGDLQRRAIVVRRRAASSSASWTPFVLVATAVRPFPPGLAGAAPVGACSGGARAPSSPPPPPHAPSRVLISRAATARLPLRAGARPGFRFGLDSNNAGPPHKKNRSPACRASDSNNGRYGIVSAPAQPRNLSPHRDTRTLQVPLSPPELVHS